MKKIGFKLIGEIEAVFPAYYHPTEKGGEIE